MDEDINNQYCDLIDKDLPLNHTFFKYDSEIKIAESFIGLAISEGKNVDQLRNIIDILDTLNENLYDSDVKLEDMVRKQLRREDSTWVDINQKMNDGNRYTADLIIASSHLRNAVSYLYELKNDDDFSEHVNNYQIEYMLKLINRLNNEAIGDVLL